MQAADKVHWTQTSRRGRTISMRRRKGVIESIEGEFAVVRYGRSGRTRIAVRLLSLVGQPGALDRVMAQIRGDDPARTPSVRTWPVEREE